ncbi:hypothetical protein JCGZ_26854 [Jatropha curcas]|uniref:Uncharacterized protein n=1 Tax=Jatropha curcas TaxID=180498 RepID=A0A067L062_JATCU|nr:hypothetical protein JCGZ_26854 [Jatropha curcas]
MVFQHQCRFLGFNHEVYSDIGAAVSFQWLWVLRRRLEQKRLKLETKIYRFKVLKGFEKEETRELKMVDQVFIDEEMTSSIDEEMAR